MAEPKEILIDQAIAHVLTPHKPGGSVFSSAELPLSTRTQIISFLQTHIANSLTHDEIRSATFSSSSGSHAVRDLCHSVINDSKQFVGASQKLGELLNDQLVKNQRISAGTLACCVYRLVSTKDRRLALLKLDPTETIVQQTQKSGKNVVVVWEPTDNALPSTGQDLHKCAFIQIPGAAKEPDLHILDWQNRSSPEPAKFFTEGFLQAVLHADEAMLTQRFHSVASRAIERLRNTLGNKTTDAAKHILNASLSSKKIVVNSFVDSLNIPTAHATALRKEIKGVISESFKPDEEVADRLRNKVRITGKFGMRLTVERDHFERLVTVGKEKNDPQYGTYTELTVRAYDYKQE